MRARPWEMPEYTMWKSQTLWEESRGYENSLYAWWVVKFELWVSDLRNCWKLIITIGLHKIVLVGRIVSGYSCYASKHKIIMG